MKIEMVRREVIENFIGKKPKKASKYFGVYSHDKIIGFISYGKPMGLNVATSISSSVDPDRVSNLKDIYFENFLANDSIGEILDITCNVMSGLYNTQAIIAHVEEGDRYINVLRETLWFSQGNKISKKRYLHNINGELLCDRTCWDRYKTTSYEKLFEIDSNYKRQPIPKKERFIVILDKLNLNKIVADSKHELTVYMDNN